MVGIVPRIISLAHWQRQHDQRQDQENKHRQAADLRMEVAKFVQAVCSASELTLQMFISCGGMAVRLLH